MIILIEGPRNTGKTFLLQEYNTFKFPFTKWFQELGLKDQSRETHNVALAKEIMLHQLNRDGHITKDLIVDRGIITTWVWGIMQERITIREAITQIDFWNARDLFKDTHILLVEGDNPQEREEKDIWDGVEYDQEQEIYSEVIKVLTKQGINIGMPFINRFDENSTQRFRTIITEIKNS